MVVIRRGSIDTETGNRIAGEDLEEMTPASAPVPPAPSGPTSFDVLSKERAVERQTRLQKLLADALHGRLERERDPHYWEMAKLNDTHVEMIFDSIQGMSGLEIAEKYGYTPSRVSIILSHPDAITIKTSLLAANADTLTDLTQRFKLLAPEMVAIKTDIVRDKSTPAAVRDKIASDILDRAGYGAIRREERHVEHSVSIPASIAAQLTAGMDESKRVATLDYTKHLRKSQDDEVAQAANLSLTDGHQSEESDTLRTPDPETTTPAPKKSLGDMQVWLGNVKSA